MPIFEYKAFDEGGSVRTGIIDADTARDARQRLRGDRIHVTDIWTAEDVRKERRPRRAAFGRNRAVGELTLVTRQFATLLAAGITVVDALKALIDQVGTRDLEKVLRDVREKVTQGQTLAEALALHPAYFSDLYVNMVRAGEASGNLDLILNRLAQYLQKQNRLRNRVSAALAYPMVMVAVGIIVVMILMTFVVPNLTQVFAKAQKTLPPPTVVLMSVSQFLARYWWLLILFVLGAYGLLEAFRKTERGAVRWDGWMLRLPLFGQLFRKQAISRFATTMATLLRSGVTVLDALKIVRTVVRNRVVAATVGDIHESIVEGTDIATPLKKSGVFPPMVGYMIATGEQSGQLEEILEKVAESYDEEIDVTTQKLTSLLEPVIIVVLAAVVGFIVISIVLPLLQMSSFAG